MYKTFQYVSCLLGTGSAPDSCDNGVDQLILLRTNNSSLWYSSPKKKKKKKNGKPCDFTWFPFWQSIYMFTVMHSPAAWNLWAIAYNR